MSDSIDKRSQFYGRKKARPLRTIAQELIDGLLPEIEINNLSAIKELMSNDYNKNNNAKSNWLEIGFGGGEHLAAQASNNRDVNFIGCEPFINGIASFLKLYKKNNLDNVRVYTEDARFLLEALPDKSINRIFVLFPDPWTKKRHHKRRIVNKDTIKQFHRILEDGGNLRIASDDPSYIEWIWEHMINAVSSGMFNASKDKLEDFATQPNDWVETRYEKKAKEQGRTCYYMDFIKK